jgi:hypothetical protein
MTTSLHLNEHGDAPRPDGEDRFAVYAIGLDGERHRLAETSTEGLGITLLTLHSEGEFHHGERALRVGVFDRESRLWIIMPWAGSRP